MGNTYCGAGPRQAYTDEQGRELNSKRMDSDIDDPVVKTRAGDEVPSEDGHTPIGACVFLNVYDLFMMNLTSEKYGIGLYHTGVEIMSDEYSFIGGPDDMCSVIKTYPGDTSWMQNGRFKESLYVGRCKLTKFELQTLRIKFARAQPCSSYDLLANNCNHFSQKMIREVTGNPYYELPGRVNRMADMGDRVRCCLPSAITNPIPPHEQHQQQQAQQQQQQKPQVKASNETAFGYGVSNEFTSIGSSNGDSSESRTASTRQRKSRMPSLPLSRSTSTSARSTKSNEQQPLVVAAAATSEEESGSANETNAEEQQWNIHQAPYVTLEGAQHMQNLRTVEAELQ